MPVDDPHVKGPAVTKVSIVVPAYREEARIAHTVAALRAGVDAAAGPVEIVVVDDGSDDHTAQAARAAGADVVISLEQNRGKGAAVRAGMLAASGEIVAFTDADMAYAPDQVARVVSGVAEGADVVIGSRRHPDATAATKASAVRSVGSRLVHGAAWVLGLGRFRDTQCGLKALRGEAARAILEAAVIDGFAFDVELLYLARRCGLGVREVPVEVANSSNSSVRVLRHGPAMARDLLRIRMRAFTGGYRTPRQSGRGAPRAGPGARRR